MECIRFGCINSGDGIMIDKQYGPTLAISDDIHAKKYRSLGETFREAMSRVANTLADDPEHFYKFRDVLLNMRFLPGGRVQSAIGSPRKVTALNCFGSQIIPDSMAGIMDAAKGAALTMRKGGGIGYDFSTIRPRGDKIVTMDSPASGVVSFMHIFDTVCATISSAGNRRGAQMGVLRVDHPDIEEFIEAKTNATELTKFNISVGVTDAFMKAVEQKAEFDLVFNDIVYKKVYAPYLWDKIMRASFDWAEPGILFLDTINKMNNLYYCEVLALTNPCGEVPLPPYGACLLGSFNLVQYLYGDRDGWKFDWEGLIADIPHVVRAMDNVTDRTTYPLPEQEEEAQNKRRMGLGLTGLANAGEALGHSYGSDKFNRWHNKVAKLIANEAYRCSTVLAKEKGAFPLYDHDKIMESKFIKRLDKDVQAEIDTHGLRTSHLLSIAPTGTISLSADNISSGIEPVFSLEYDRTIQEEAGAKIETVTDYGHRVLGVDGKTADNCTLDEHLSVLLTATKWVDAAVSKTINVGEDVTWEDFKDVYYKAWKGGAKGCTTFRSAGERYGILNKKEDGGACTIDTTTGKKTCD